MTKHLLEFNGAGNASIYAHLNSTPLSKRHYSTKMRFERYKRSAIVYLASGLGKRRDYIHRLLILRVLISVSTLPSRCIADEACTFNIEGTVRKEF